jgi:signal transduction histidine kinase
VFGSEPQRSATLIEQQASLRRLAAVVAAGAASADVFAAIAREVAHVLCPRLVQIFRWERDGSVTVVGTWGDEPNPFPAGSNWPWEDASLVALMERMRAGQLIRVEDVAGSLAGALRDAGLRVGIGSAAGAPIVVEGEVWGHMSVEMTKGAPLPDGVEQRLAEMTELVATAIVSSATREELARLANEQAALRRVATLVARGAPPADVFHAVAEELGRLLDVASSGLVRFEDEHTARVVAGWGRLGEIMPLGARLPIGGRNAISEIARTGKPARVDYDSPAASGPIADQARRLNTGTSIGGPIAVAGQLWGAVVAAALDGASLPPDAQPRLEQFVELVGTAIANAEARVELARLADEQAALRRVATLVAEEVPVQEIFARVGAEVAGVLGPAIESAILRYEADDTATVMAGSSDAVPGGIVVGERLTLGGGSVTARVFRERRPVRVDDYATAEGEIAAHASKHAIRSAIGCPILVKGSLWGSMVVAHREAEPFGPDVERRVSQFTELVATAIANAEARAELQRLADEQAALRRVATLVAEAAAPTEVFDAAIVEVAQLLGASLVGLMRAESSSEITILARRGQDPALVQTGMRLPLDGESVTARVLRTGRSARIDLHQEGSGTITEVARRSNALHTVGAPITVEGRIWGVITASWGGRELPLADAEERLAHFAQLLGTAIANADSRDQLTASRARVLTAGDEARRRVVRDLHDGAQQRLVQTMLTLKLAQQTVREDPDEAESLIAEALDSAEQSNAELRELAHGLLPAALTHGGLRAGVASVVSRLDLPVDAEVTSSRLPLEIEASAYFIVAEALTNVVKHAQATRAAVTASVDNGKLSIEVRDDGTGGADPEGHGLLGIGDRVAALGGRLHIDSPRRGGTVLTAELPLGP